MGKIALISDIHFGVRNDNQFFVDEQEAYYRDQFIPTLLMNNVDHVIIAGDLFDRRKYVNFNTLHRVRKFFFDPLETLGIELYIIVGNHDTYHKNSVQVNSPRLLLNGYSNISVYDEPSVVTIDGIPLAFFPWITDSNLDDSVDMVNQCVEDGVEYAIGHFEFTGFSMYKGGVVCQDGISPSAFDSFERVFSGHFHEPSSQGNITYLGAPMQYRWNDYGCDRGFYLADFDAGEFEYVKNTKPLFVRHEYRDDAAVAFGQFKNKIVEVVINEQYDPSRFDAFIAELEAANPHEWKTVDNSQLVVVEEVSEDVVKSEDTKEIISEYVDSSYGEYDKERVKGKFFEIYDEVVQ